jgi:hypothetical protein
MTARPGKSIILMSYNACREGLPTSSGPTHSKKFHGSFHRSTLNNAKSLTSIILIYNFTAVDTETLIRCTGILYKCLNDSIEVIEMK